MRILIVEDDPRKYEDIRQFLMDEGIVQSNIDWAKSQEGTKLFIYKIKYNLILLDMSLPLYDTDNISYYSKNEQEIKGGLAILDELEINEIDANVVVVTAYDRIGDVDLNELHKKMQKDYPYTYVGKVYYRVTYVDWHKELNYFIQKYIGETIR